MGPPAASVAMAIAAISTTVRFTGPVLSFEEQGPGAGVIYSMRILLSKVNFLSGVACATALVEGARHDPAQPHDVRQQLRAFSS